MGKITLALLSLLLCGPCFAAEPEVRKFRIFEALEVFWPGSADDALLQDQQAAARALVAGGFVSANASVRRQSALGARVGLLLPHSIEGLDLGVSAGYLSGPNSKAEIRAVDAAQAPGMLSYDRRLQFLRALLEARMNVPLAGRWSVNLGGGVGAAQGFGRISCSASGSLAGRCPYDYVTTAWNGFSWELASSLDYRVSSTNLALGVYYAGLPRFDGTSSVSRIVWTPLGVFFGAAFRLD